jgi:hypothetical protein
VKDRRPLFSLTRRKDRFVDKDKPIVIASHERQKAEGSVCGSDDTSNFKMSGQRW